MKVTIDFRTQLRLWTKQTDQHYLYYLYYLIINYHYYNAMLWYNE